MTVNTHTIQALLTEPIADLRLEAGREWIVRAARLTHPRRRRRSPGPRPLPGVFPERGK
jgi:hypothetical protein